MYCSKNKVSLWVIDQENPIICLGGRNLQDICNLDEAWVGESDTFGLVVNGIWLAFKPNEEFSFVAKGEIPFLKDFNDVRWLFLEVPFESRSCRKVHSIL